MPLCILSRNTPDNVYCLAYDNQKEFSLFILAESVFGRIDCSPKRACRVEYGRLGRLPRAEISMNVSYLVFTPAV